MSHLAYQATLCEVSTLSLVLGKGKPHGLRDTMPNSCLCGFKHQLLVYNSHLLSLQALRSLRPTCLPSAAWLTPKLLLHHIMKALVLFRGWRGVSQHQQAAQVLSNNRRRRQACRGWSGPGHLSRADHSAPRAQWRRKDHHHFHAHWHNACHIRLDPRHTLHSS